MDKSSKGRVLPILFNTEMVQAILAGKSVTRRPIKPRYRADESGFVVFKDWDTGMKSVEKTDRNREVFDSPRYVIPPCQRGDVLYVRETWQHLYELDINEEVIEGTGKYYYAATDSIPFDTYIDPEGVKHEKTPWRPSIHMPKAAARIWLKVTNVWVERLQEIDEEQAMAEGCGGYLTEAKFRVSPLCHFMEVWNSTIKKPDMEKYGWDATPWVWVIEFERCEKPEEG